MYDELIAELRRHHCNAKEDDTQEVCDECAYDVIIADKSVPSGIASVCVCGLMNRAADAIEELSKPKWIPVTERLPENGVHVLLSCKCGAGAYVCDGFHTEKYSTPTQFYEDIDADYDDETDEYYFPEGWWEVVKNWDDYSCVAIEDTVTHWMPLPEPPKEE